MPGNVAVLVDEMRRQRRAQLDSILGRAGSSGGGLPQMGALPQKQHGDPKANVSSLYQGYQQLQQHFPNSLPAAPSVSSMVGSLPQSVGAGVASGAAVPSLAGGTFSSIPAGAAISASPALGAGGAATAGIGGTGALGALSSAGSAIGSAASAAGSGASSLIGYLASLI